MDWTKKAEIFRRAFRGRQDVYGKKWTAVRDGEIRSGYMPVCENLFQDICHLKNKTGKRCADCEHKVYTPVSNESVLKHILGEEEHCQYVLLDDGTINFGALDFDCKKGKEEKGYSWDDVRRTSDVLTEWNIPHHIARSTTDGYHIYFFFAEPYKAHRFRSFVMELYDHAGLLDLAKNASKPLVEFFPKSSNIDAHMSIGNGIKPPMIEPRIGREEARNCFVDRDNQVIGGDLPEMEDTVEEQWRYLDTAARITGEIEAIIQRFDVPIEEDEDEAIGPTGTRLAKKAHTRTGRSKKWQQPLGGSIEKMLESCQAYRKLKEKALAGQVLGHDEGFSLFHICMSVADGLDWFRKNVRGWGETQAQLNQLEQSLDKNYSPWTCQKVQDRGICSPGTKCFNKKPPTEMMDGMEVLRTDLPESMWPQPSPIRYAYGKGEDYLDLLKGEASAACEIQNDDEKVAKFKELAARVQVFDEGQIKEFQAFVKELKPFKKVSDLRKIWKDANLEQKEAQDRRVADRSDHLKYEGKLYRQDEDFGYTLIKHSKQTGQVEVKLISVDLDIEEERCYQASEEESPIRHYIGVVRWAGTKLRFEIPVSDWIDTQAFTKYFANLCGTRFNPLREDIPYLKQAAIAFSQRRGIERTLYLTTQGFSGDVYLMPSVIIDATGCRPNTTNIVDLSQKEVVKNLDFDLLEESDFRETLLHIKNEFLTAWPELWTMTGLAHTLMPVAMRLVRGFDKHPTLFFEGLTGSGKTELTMALQNFWGSFKSLLNLQSTSRSLQELAYEFKDATLVLDDYKGIDKQQVKTLLETIQYAYDGGGSSKLNRDSSIRKVKTYRANFIMSGEEFLTNQASTTARTILIETEKQDFSQTADKFMEVQRNMHRYRGVTPRFIQWALAANVDGYHELFQLTKVHFIEKMKLAQNVSRVSQNLGANYVCWVMFCDFLLDSGAVTPEECKELKEKHRAQLESLQEYILKRCGESQNGLQFASFMRQMLLTNLAKIQGLHGYDMGSGPMIGYAVKTGAGDITSVYIYPDVAFQAVMETFRVHEMRSTPSSIARQLREAGVIVDSDPGRNTKQTRTDEGGRARVWCVSLEKLGLTLVDPPKQVRQANGDPATLVNFPHRDGMGLEP